jgi:hypothetical protein
LRHNARRLEVVGQLRERPRRFELGPPGVHAAAGRYCVHVERRDDERDEPPRILFVVLCRGEAQGLAADVCQRREIDDRLRHAHATIVDVERADDVGDPWRGEPERGEIDLLPHGAGICAGVREQRAEGLPATPFGRADVGFGAERREVVRQAARDGIVQAEQHRRRLRGRDDGGGRRRLRGGIGGGDRCGHTDEPEA